MKVEEETQPIGAKVEDITAEVASLEKKSLGTLKETMKTVGETLAH